MGMGSASENGHPGAVLEPIEKCVLRIPYGVSRRNGVNGSPGNTQHAIRSTFSLVVERGQQAHSPKGQCDKSKTPDSAKGKPAATLRKLPAHDDKSQVNEPNEGGPNDFRIAAKGMGVHDLGEAQTPNRQTNRPQKEAAEQKPADDHFEPLYRWHKGEYRLELVEFEVSLLREVH